MTKRAVILLSGGLDSAVTLAIARARGYDCLALSFDYGQRHVTELRNAAAIAAAAGIGHCIYTLDTRAFAGAALTSTDTDLPHHTSAGDIPAGRPVTYVPARNTIMLAHALAAAETWGASSIFIGVNHLDHDGYPDCRQPYLDAFSAMASLATWAGPIEIIAPLIDKTKADIVAIGAALDVDFSQTMSCYDPLDAATACGRCDACLLRAEGFEVAGIADR